MLLSFVAFVFSYFFCLQVVDFLSGKAPLNLTMRLGDHMMLIQLQLSTVNSSSNAAKRSRTSSATASSPNISRTPVSSNAAAAAAAAAASAAASAAAAAAAASSGDAYKPKLDTRALTEASKNLTKTLRQLSSEVLTTKCEEVREIKNQS